MDPMDFIISYFFKVPGRLLYKLLSAKSSLQPFSDAKKNWMVPKDISAVAQRSRSLCYRFLDERWTRTCVTGVENEGLESKKGRLHKRT